MTTTEKLSPAAQARFDAAPAWMQNNSGVNWEADPKDAIKRARKSSEDKDRRARYGGHVRPY